MTKVILILHDLSVGSRRTNRDHVYNFSKYQKGNLYIFHCARAPITDELKQIDFDGVIINYCFLGNRAGGHYHQYKKGFAWIRDLNCPKIALCQDDYTDNEILDEWLDYMNITTIYSPIQENVNILYPINWGRKTFKLGLTAYTDSVEMDELQRYATPYKKRKFDVGTRVRYLPPQFGRYGRIKGETAEDFRDAADVAGFLTNISTDPQDVIFGSHWLKFVGNCRFTLGSKGGSSLCDPRGDIRKDISEYMVKNPDAGFTEVEKMCFPDLDNRYIFAGVSPRLFEAAALKTCQILIRDEYVGGLEEYVDYIPLDEDLSNLEEVFELMRDDDKCMAMTESCYQKLIASKQFDYGYFVDDVLSQIPEKKKSLPLKTIKLVEAHFEQLKPYSQLRKKCGGFTEQLWRRVLYFSEFSDVLDYAGSVSELPDGLSICPSAADHLMDLPMSTHTLCQVSEVLSYAKFFGAGTSEMKHILKLIVVERHNEGQWAFWWDMCEYIYEPLTVLAKPVVRQKPRVQKRTKKSAITKPVMNTRTKKKRATTKVSVKTTTSKSVRT
ncbi:MAG: glycosyltransferase family 1 protein [Robiginitomaculum sp.]|nr:glycosyltransferase family 1 protein [Robiginitomaculum sp.]